MGKIGQDRGPAAAGRTRAGDDAHAAPGITDVAYRPAMSAPLGMDVVDFPELWARGRHRGIDLTAPQRPDFHHLIHVHPDARPLAHTVDFATHVVPPGGWLWVRPRQVHQYTAGPDGGPAVPRGLMVIWRPGFVADDPPPQAGPLVPSGAQARLVRLALDHLVAEYDEVGSLPLEAHNRTLRSLLSVLLLRLAHACPAGAAPGPPDGPFARFRAAVERDLSRTHRVADYAAALGYSTRTLTRATRAATGTTAKNYLDTRILLEAKRLLVHTDAGSADIARRLGFGDPGDFGKFFRRLDGRTPLAFRAQARGTPGR